jgi:hypothetical protein
MCALKPAHLMEGFQIFANRDQGSREAPRKVLDHNPAVTLSQLKNFSPPLFCKHLFLPCFRFITFCYYFELSVIA